MRFNYVKNMHYYINENIWYIYLLCEQKYQVIPDPHKVPAVEAS